MSLRQTFLLLYFMYQLFRDWQHDSSLTLITDDMNCTHKRTIVLRLTFDLEIFFITRSLSFEFNPAGRKNAAFPTLERSFHLFLRRILYSSVQCPIIVQRIINRNFCPGQKLSAYQLLGIWPCPSFHILYITKNTISFSSMSGLKNVFAIFVLSFWNIFERQW